MAPSVVARRSIAGVATWRMKSLARAGFREPLASVSIQKTLSETLRPPAPAGGGAMSILPFTAPSALSPTAAKPNRFVISAILPS